MKSIIAQLLAFRSTAHIQHWKATRFSAHLALEEFYEKLTELTDELVEVYSGKYGVLQDLQSAHLEEFPDAKSFINYAAIWIEYSKAEVPQDSFLENIYDEIMAVAWRAKFKIDNLA